MTLKLSQLSDKLQRLDWGKSKYVACTKSFTIETFESKCSLCQKNLKPSNSKNHILIGSSEPNVEEVISAFHYLCRNCKKQCTVCGY